MIQALTPDALDLTLLANHRPPGPVVALMSMLAEEREIEEEPAIYDRCRCRVSVIPIAIISGGISLVPSYRQRDAAPLARARAVPDG